MRISLNQVFILAEIRNFLIQVVNSSVEVARTIDKQVLSLVAARLVVQDDDDHVPIDFLPFSGQLFEQLLSPLQVLKSRGRFFIPQVVYCVLVEFKERGVQIGPLGILLDFGIFAYREVIGVSWILNGLLLLSLQLGDVLLLENQLHNFSLAAAVGLLDLIHMFGQRLRDDVDRSIFFAVRGFPRC